MIAKQTLLATKLTPSGYVNSRLRQNISAVAACLFLNHVALTVPVTEYAERLLCFFKTSLNKRTVRNRNIKSNLHLLTNLLLTTRLFEQKIKIRYQSLENSDHFLSIDTARKCSVSNFFCDRNFMVKFPNNVIANRQANPLPNQCNTVKIGTWVLAWDFCC